MFSGERPATIVCSAMVETTPFAAVLASTSCAGGAGRDTFDFNHIVESGYGRAAPDLIADFAHGLDRIDLSGIDANVRVAGNQAFAFLGAKNFTAHAGELITRAYGPSTYMFADVNGDGHADMQIQFVGHINLGRATSPVATDQPENPS